MYGSKRNGLGDLIRKNESPKKLSVSMVFKNDWATDVNFSFGNDAKKMVGDLEVHEDRQKQTSNDVFIPEGINHIIEHDIHNRNCKKTASVD